MAQQISDEEMKARQKKRSIALALSLAGFAVIMYVLALVKMGPNLFDRVL